MTTRQPSESVALTDQSTRTPAVPQGAIGPQKRHTFDTFWAYVGKLSLTVGLIWGVIQIANWVRAPSLGLVATGQLHSFRLPAEIRETWAQFDRKLRQCKVARQLEGKALKEPSANRYTFDGLANALLDDFDLDDLSSIIASVNTLIAIVVENTGSQEISDLQLGAPFEGFAQISRPGAVPKLARFSQVVELGSLRPASSLAGTLWVLGHHQSTSFEGTLKVTHKDGHVSVQLLHPFTGFRALITGKLDLFIGAMLGLAIVIAHQWKLSRKAR